MEMVVEFGTTPADQVSHELAPGSANVGRLGEDALVGNRPQAQAPAGPYALFRVGDAVASCNFHAAIYDSLRLCHKMWPI
ncbi:MAG: hypothetical protein ACI8W7_003069 [Gammaproteobacteria bacterium]|jgi:hypothetical protein